MDHRGDLILVETKRVQKDHALQDPYEDYVAFEKKNAFPDVPSIRRKWQPLYQAELHFIRECREDLQKGIRTSERWPGVVGYGRKRLMVWRWRELYLRRFAPFLTGEYEKFVERNLGLRERAGNPPPHYFALFTLFDDSYPRLSAMGEENFAELAKLAGRDRLHARAVAARPIEGNQVRIQSPPVNIFGDAH